MKKIKLMNIVILVITILLVMINTYTVQATINPGDYEPNAITQDDVTLVTNMANPIIGGIKTLGIVVAVIVIGVIGIKYMTGSVEEKAEYKKTIIPYLIGAVIVVAITQLLGIIIEIVTNIK